MDTQETNTTSTQSMFDPTTTPNEMEILKGRARMLGITFSNNIGIDALRLKVDAKMDASSEPEQATEDAEDYEDEVADEPSTADEPAIAPVVAVAAELEANALVDEPPEPPVKISKEAALRAKIFHEQMKLVRLRITCLDPKKKDLPGEIITIANEYLGTVRKFIPFGEVTDDGFHVPFCLYTFLKEREFLNIRTIKDRRTGTTRMESNYVKEFALEILPQLTEDELERLAVAQKAAGSVDQTLR